VGHRRPSAIAGSGAAAQRMVGRPCGRAPAAAYASVPRESLGRATTAINICQRFGGPVGTTGLAIFLQYELARTTIPATAYAWTFWVLAGLAAAAVLAASQLPGARRRV
jgi:hypothetical protein